MAANLEKLVATPAEKQTIKTFSRDQLILPETEIPQEVSDILQRAERAGLTFFEPHHLSGVTLQQDLAVEGWDKKPENWYWEQIKNGKISQGASRLSGSWVLIDKTVRPDYKDGKQLHVNDSLGTLLARLRKENKISIIKGIPETSRFGISFDELTNFVLPEIARLLGVEVSQVRLPKEIEFNVIGNFKHPEWGTANTWEWLEDKLGDSRRLFGGFSVFGGLSHVALALSVDRNDLMAFRPLVAVSPKA